LPPSVGIGTDGRAFMAEPRCNPPLPDRSEEAGGSNQRGPTVRIASCLSIVALLPTAASAQSLLSFSEDFDRYDLSAFSGTDGWESGYASDPWSTEFGDGIYATTDGSFGIWGSGDPIDNHLVYTGSSFDDTTVLATLETEDNDTMGLVVRYQDPENFYLGFVTNDRAPNIGTGAPKIPWGGAHIYKVVAGNATEIGWAPMDYRQGDPQPMQFSAVGTTLELWFDLNDNQRLDANELLLTVDDATFADGQFGLYCYDHGDIDGSSCTFDDLTVNVADFDGDGHAAYSNGGDDCDDRDAAVFPGAPETCNSVDDDCDDQIDEGVKSTYYADADHDGYGSAAFPTLACSGTVGLAADATDCDDHLASVHPYAPELVADGVDEDCDGLEACWDDADLDGWGTTDTVPSVDLVCDAPGEAVQLEDCDGADPSVHPFAAEVCDGIDQDCNGAIDDGVSVTYYTDDDHDGFGDPASATPVCGAPGPDQISDGSDCDDTDTGVFPGAVEVCDGVDQDCNGVLDDGLTTPAWMDVDGDGYGDPHNEVGVCGPTPGTVYDHQDCDDLDATVHPGALEVTDGVDQDCTGVADDGFDADGDGLIDGDELLIWSTDPHDPDSDDDLLRDGDEVFTCYTDPNNPDTDHGGVQDGTEVLGGTDPLDPTDDTEGDTDHDGLADLQEPYFGTDPHDADSDDDGLLDGAEALGSTVPTDPDADDDGLLDGIEAGVVAVNPDSADFPGDADPSTTTDPTNPDTDGDGLSDGVEDADGDGAWFVAVGGTGTEGVGESDPTGFDSDGDGLRDGEEVDRGWSPIDTDSDDGGIEDGEEALRGTDPLNPHDDYPSDIGLGFYHGGCDCDATGGTPGGAWLGLVLLVGTSRRVRKH
jgi:hypothetical protein